MVRFFDEKLADLDIDANLTLCLLINLNEISVLFCQKYVFAENFTGNWKKNKKDLSLFSTIQRNDVVLKTV